ncbi:hypothetical protein NEMBOFW57_009069 [Staphylotrichum longicolle]|uniref:Indoleamine 2,3-dioxygenase n=1 Tax=Staphylotrichum longicolle TaxID=669026 RepID=A0AAD4HXW2_9PEZI|nr:hypothetical protein NEMBOFW57_009069 [Staphylotrichum longicolle]
MLPPIPVLADYGLSPTHGFLPDVLPLTRLPDPYYNKWEAVVANLQGLILSKRLRGVVDRLPHLEVPPVATYAAVCLWNFKPLFMDEDIDNLENLSHPHHLHRLPGRVVVLPRLGGHGSPRCAHHPADADCHRGRREDDAITVTSCLHTFAERLDDLTTLLLRMHESCDPHIFYHRIRPFLAGSKNMADAGLPNGVLYEDGSGNETYRQYAGGSNAQSSLIQFFDIVLGIEHRPTGEKQPTRGRDAEREGRAPPPKHNFIMEMRRYMPGPHARFLSDVQAVANIRDYVERNQANRPLCVAYDACLSMLRALRDKHIAIVTRYIVLPSREVRARSRSPEATRRKVNLATASRAPAAAGNRLRRARRRRRGQGPTTRAAPPRRRLPAKGLARRLKQARDERRAAIEEWTKRFMSRQPRTEGQGDFFAGKPEEGAGLQVHAAETEEVALPGLAGSWTMDDDVGGICNY